MIESRRWIIDRDKSVPGIGNTFAPASSGPRCRIARPQAFSVGLVEICPYIPHMQATFERFASTQWRMLIWCYSRFPNLLGKSNSTRSRLAPLQRRIAYRLSPACIQEFFLPVRISRRIHIRAIKRMPKIMQDIHLVVPPRRM